MYPQKLRRYLEKHTVSEFVAMNPVLNQYTDDTKELVIILDIQQITAHMSQVIDIGQAVAHIMKLKQSQLLIHNIAGGSVIVAFLVPIMVAEYIFRGPIDCIFSQEQIEEFRKISILVLECNGYKFDFSFPSSKSCIIAKTCDELVILSPTPLGCTINKTVLLHKPACKKLCDLSISQSLLLYLISL